MSYQQSNEWVNYCKLMQERPDEFKNTGNIDTFMELMAFQNIEKNINVNGNIKVNEYGDNKDQGLDNFRK